MNILKKSNTINFNVVAASVVTILTSFGVEVPVEAVTAVFTLGNIFFRFLTTKPLKDK